jgi:hypothetical protein
MPISPEKYNDGERFDSNRTLVVKTKIKRKAEIKLLNDVNPFKIENFQVIDEEEN